MAEFEQAFNLTRGTPGRQLDAQNVQILQNAVELYRGDLLEGWYQDWCLFERERLQNMYLTMLDKLIDYSEANELYEAGLAYGAHILRHDRARERTHRRLMRLHYLARDRTEALRQYERCVSSLDKELGVEPDVGQRGAKLVRDLVDEGHPARGLAQLANLGEEGRFFIRDVDLGRAGRFFLFPVGGVDHRQKLLIIAHFESLL